MPSGLRASWLILFAALSGASASDSAPRRLTADPVSGIRLVWIPAGTFPMGSPPGEVSQQADETPHRVSITDGFWLGETEVTQRQWARMMGNNPSHFQDCGLDCPVESVTWNDVQGFLERLNKASGGGFRLPTEAEWEFACRAGSTTAYSTGGTLSTARANFNGKHPVRVGSFPANSWGLFDMHGNVWEWCQDWYGPYPVGVTRDPAGPAVGSLKVIRGGSWYFGVDSCRCALRYTHAPADRGFSLGFRVARTYHSDNGRKP